MVVCIISRFIIDGVVDLCRVADQLDLVLELMQSLIGFVWFVSLQTQRAPHTRLVGAGGKAWRPRHDGTQQQHQRWPAVGNWAAT